jgi:hypothetical protein
VHDAADDRLNDSRAIRRVSLHSDAAIDESRGFAAGETLWRVESRTLRSNGPISG